MAMQGNLATMPVPELLMWISQYQKTGTLEIRTSRSTETMAFENGMLVFSSSTNPEATLGRLLIKNGILTEDMHTQARALRQTKSVAVGKALIDLEMMTEAELLRFLRKKAEKELFDLCELKEGEFTFTDKALPKLELLPMQVDVSRMLLRITQDRDEKGEYDFDASGIRLDIPRDV